MRAIAAGRTKHQEIAAAVGTEPARTLDRLIELRLVERVVPVTEARSRTTRKLYRIADNYLAFWLGVVDRYRAEIDRGLGVPVAHAVESSLNNVMGRPWEDAFRWHLRRLIAAGEVRDDIVAVGPWWTKDGSVELDAVGLAGRQASVALVGEAKWATKVRGEAILDELTRKSAVLPGREDELVYAVCARHDVGRLPTGALGVTAADIFSA